MKLETSPKVTKSKRSLHSCRSISKKYLCTFYYSISQKVITLSGRRFITVSGVLLHYRAVITLSGVFYYIIGRLLHYRLVQPSLYFSHRVLMTNVTSVVPTPGLKPNWPSEMLTMSLSLWSMIRSQSFIVWLSSVIPL